MPEHALSSNHPQAALPAAQSVAVDPAAIKQDDSEGLFQRLPVQRKLAVGAADDPLEREADHIADRVMRMPEASFIQRKMRSLRRRGKGAAQTACLIHSKERRGDGSRGLRCREQPHRGYKRRRRGVAGHDAPIHGKQGGDRSFGGACSYR